MYNYYSFAIKTRTIDLELYTSYVGLDFSISTGLTTKNKNITNRLGIIVEVDKEIIELRTSHFAAGFSKGVNELRLSCFLIVLSMDSGKQQQRKDENVFQAEPHNIYK